MVAAKRHASNLPTSKSDRFRTISFITALFCNGQEGETPQWPATNKWTKTGVDIQGERYSAFKERKVWHMTQHGCTMRVRQWNPLVTTGQIPYDSTHKRFLEEPNLETESSSSQGWSYGLTGSFCLLGIQFQFCRMKKVVEMRRVAVTQVNVFSHYWTVHLEMVKTVNFMLQALYHLKKRYIHSGVRQSKYW